MAGRGGKRGGGGNTGILQMASNMGIMRHDLNSYSQTSLSGEPLDYPPLELTPQAPGPSDELLYLSDLNQKFMLRARQSEYFMSEKEQKTDVARYTDKYKQQKRSNWEPDWSQFPAELKWGSSRKGSRGGKAPTAKKQKEATVDVIKSKLELLEKREATTTKSGGDDAEDGSGSPAQNPQNAEEEMPVDPDLSDEDYLEEGNDYIDTYFDNGEDEANSDDNLDNDAVM